MKELTDWQIKAIKDLKDEYLFEKISDILLMTIKFKLANIIHIKPDLITYEVLGHKIIFKYNFWQENIDIEF